MIVHWKGMHRLIFPQTYKNRYCYFGAIEGVLIALIEYFYVITWEVNICYCQLQFFIACENIAWSSECPNAL